MLRCLINVLLILIFPHALWTFEPTPITPYPVVGYQEASFSDYGNGVYRQMLIWYPVDPLTVGSKSISAWDLFNVAENAAPASSRTKRPVIVLSHGYTGNPHQLSWLIKGLVNHAFIVLAIQHLDLIDGQPHMNHWKRAQDINQIISQFQNHLLAKAADLNKIGIAGFSLGGTTAIWVAGGRATKLQNIIPTPEFVSPLDYTMADEALKNFDKKMMAKDWRETRVKAAFVMAPGWAWLFDENSLRTITIPTYILATSEDKVLITRNNAGYFARSIPKSIYQEIKGHADHYVFISLLNEEQRKKADPNSKLTFLFENDVSIDRVWIQHQIVREAVNFFNSVFGGRENFATAV